jgi:protein required for attachment to host cells
MTIPASTWVLVADTGRARLFELRDDTPDLIEIACDINPEGRAGERRLGTDRAPTVNESVGPARHSIEPHTSAREKISHAFARRIADELERGRGRRRFGRLILVAPAKFLGALHESLGAALRDSVAGELNKDLTALPVARLQERLMPLLGKTLGRRRRATAAPAASGAAGAH